MITKIISGGQTGADRAALDAAIEMSVPHGGWIPKGRLTEAGPLPESYDLKEMPTKDYLDRTRQNVLDSDGTVVLSHGGLRGGSKQTAVFAVEAGKPLLHLDLETMGLSRASEKMFAWIRANTISVLNVAGPRSSQDPRIYERVKAVVKTVLQGLQPPVEKTMEEPMERDVFDRLARIRGRVHALRSGTKGPRISKEGRPRRPGRVCDRRPDRP